MMLVSMIIINDGNTHSFNVSGSQVYTIDYYLHRWVLPYHWHL